MPEVAVNVNGRAYRVACGPGEEERLAKLAFSLDKRVQGFVRSFGQVGEAQLLLLAALMLEDEVTDAVAERGQLDRRLREIEEAAGGASQRQDAEAAAILDALALRIETIAARLEQP
jgi:cell division protein ZapA